VVIGSSPSRYLAISSSSARASGVDVRGSDHRWAATQSKASVTARRVAAPTRSSPG
jgi:hypothetical protein